MHAAQGVAGLVVIEFRNGADWFPTQCGMAVLAGNVQIAVRATGGGVNLPLPGRRSTHRQQQKRDNQIHQDRRNQRAPPQSGIDPNSECKNEKVKKTRGRLRNT